MIQHRVTQYIEKEGLFEAFEKIAGETAPLRAQFLRVLTNELDRIQSHLLANSTYFKSLTDSCVYRQRFL